MLVINICGLMLESFTNLFSSSIQMVILMTKTFTQLKDQNFNSESIWEQTYFLNFNIEIYYFNTNCFLMRQEAMYNLNDAYNKVYENLKMYSGITKV